MSQTSRRFLIGVALAVAVTIVYGLEQYSPQAANPESEASAVGDQPSAPASVPDWAVLLGRGIGIEMKPAEPSGDAPARDS